RGVNVPTGRGGLVSTLAEPDPLGPHDERVVRRGPDERTRNDRGPISVDEAAESRIRRGERTHRGGKLAAGRRKVSHRRGEVGRGRRVEAHRGGDPAAGGCLLTHRGGRDGAGRRVLTHRSGPGRAGR